MSRAVLKQYLGGVRWKQTVAQEHQQVFIGTLGVKGFHLWVQVLDHGALGRVCFGRAPGREADGPILFQTPDKVGVEVEKVARLLADWLDETGRGLLAGVSTRQAQETTR